MSSSPSLEEFAEARVNKCYVCHSPHRAEIEAARAKNVPLPIIGEWLVTYKNAKPEDVTRDKLRRHFDNGHRKS